MLATPRRTVRAQRSRATLDRPTCEHNRAEPVSSPSFRQCTEGCNPILQDFAALSKNCHARAPTDRVASASEAQLRGFVDPTLAASLRLAAASCELCGYLDPVSAGWTRAVPVRLGRSTLNVRVSLEERRKVSVSRSPANELTFTTHGGRSSPAICELVTSPQTCPCFCGG